jgi:16S rRNA (guanine966-N2)-methyltransferase
VREALFSILAGAVQQARVLDLFSGTGALGLEALSRGADEVVFVEADPAIARVLQETVVDLGVGERCRVVRADVIAALECGTVAGRFDLVLADPPYGGGLADRILGIVARGTWLPDGGRLVIERPSREPFCTDPGAGLEFQKSARYGDTRLDFYQGAGSA